jgi:hypothetical protein
MRATTAAAASEDARTGAQGLPQRRIGGSIRCMTMASVEETTHWVFGEHRTLLAAIRGVEGMVERERAPTGDVARRIRELADLFAAHVEEEEKSPLYTEYPARFPSLKLDELKAQHGPILAALRAAADESEHAIDLTLDSPLSIKIRGAIADVRTHEAKEAAAVQQIRED